MNKPILEINIKHIGPPEASALLERHKNYRSVSQRRVRAYARAMNHGAWGLSILLVDENGDLCDGQCRLAAIIASDTEQWFAVVSGWPTEDISKLDNNQPRSKAQVAAAERGMRNCNLVLALVAMMENPSGNELRLNCEILELYDEHGALAEEVSDLSSCNGGVLRAAVHLAAFARAIIAMPERKADIIEALRKAAMMEFTEPRMSGLRLYVSWAITRGFARGGGQRRLEAYRRCARALQAYLDNESLDKLYCPQSDPFAVK